MDLAVLEVNKQINGEAIDALYVWNTFVITFDYVCICNDLHRFATFVYAKVRKPEIHGYSPDCVRLQCMICCLGGLGLITFLTCLPRLRSAGVLLGDIDSFADCLMEPKQ